MIDLLAGAWVAASSSPASTTIPTTPTAAAATLADGWAFARDVADDAAVVAAIQADSISPMLLLNG